MTEEIVERNMQLGIIPAKTPHDVIVQATGIAKELAGIIKKNRLSRQIQGREYVYVEGWSTMGAMLGVLPREVPELTRRHEDGGYEATVELIRITDGQVIGRASAFVGMDEKSSSGKLTWGSRPEYARRSMAVTRATGKAYRLGFSWIMGLAGYAPTPAEEMDIIEGEFAEKPADRKPVSQTNGAPAGVPLDLAMQEKNSEGVPYTDIATETLAAMANSLGKVLAKNNLKDAERDEKMRKLEACKAILADRSKNG